MLTEITPHEFDVGFFIAYATSDNFTGHPLYKKPKCFLHKEAAQALKKSIELAAKYKLKIKIFDAFRPLEIQRKLWAKYPDPEFISNPDTGKTPHCRGIAIDMTLMDSGGVELDMGTDFDAFTPLSHHGSDGISDKAKENRLLLLDIMHAAGWLHNPKEWWHYQLPNHEKYVKLTDSEAGTGML